MFTVTLSIHNKRAMFAAVTTIYKFTDKRFSIISIALNLRIIYMKGFKPKIMPS